MCDLAFLMSSFNTSQYQMVRIVKLTGLCNVILTHMQVVILSNKMWDEAVKETLVNMRRQQEEPFLFQGQALDTAILLQIQSKM